MSGHRLHLNGTSTAPLRYRVPALPDRATILRQVLAGWLHAAGMPAATVDAAVLAAYEAMSNVVVHAYHGQVGLLDLQAVADRDTVTVTVTDTGRWRAPPDPPPPGSGRGLPLIRGLADHATITPTEHGTTVRLTWHGLTGPAGAEGHRPGAVAGERTLSDN